MAAPTLPRLTVALTNYPREPRLPQLAVGGKRVLELYSADRLARGGADHPIDLADIEAALGNKLL